MFAPRWTTAGMTTALVALALSGCVAEDTSQERDVDRPDVQADFTEDTGSILGLVVDESELPIEGASAGIANPPVQTTTNEEGQFALNRVPPGEYQLQATALGYKVAATRVTVTAGQVTEGVTIMLPKLAADVPYHKTDIVKLQFDGLMWKLTPDCIYTDTNPGGIYTLKTCGGVRFGEGEKHYGAEEITDEWKTIVGEVTWVPQSGVSGRGFNFDINAPNTPRGTGGSISPGDPHQWQENTDSPPIQIRIDNPTTLEEKGVPEEDWYVYPNNDCEAAANGGQCDWFWRMFPAYCDLGNCEDGFGPDYGVMLDGTVDVYFSYFIKEPAPDGFTALPEE